MATPDSCLCGTGLNNTGLVNCIKLFKKVTGMYLVPLVANDGTTNSLDLTTTIDMTAKTQHTDPSKRWYPIQDLKDVELPTAESRFETAKDGSKFLLAKGINSFKATIFESNPIFTAKLQGVSCEKVGVVMFDIEGNARGLKVGTTLEPIEIGGWDALFMGATDDNVSKTTIQFDFDILLKIANYWILSSTDLGVDPNKSVGLVDANMVASTPTATSTVITVYSDYGSGTDTYPAPITGLVTADFSGYNDTDSASISVTASEGADGVYTLSYSAETVTDAVTFKVLPASGYEGTVSTVLA